VTASPSPTDFVRINAGLNIPQTELSFTFERSSGPGGQNVNKVATRVTLLFDVEASEALSAAQKSRIRDKLATRINREGVLRVVSSRHRTQSGNRNAAVERFSELLADALYRQRRRIPTKTPKSVKEKRLSDKSHRAKAKDRRRPPSLGD